MLVLYLLLHKNPIVSHTKIRAYKILYINKCILTPLPTSVQVNTQLHQTPPSVRGTMSDFVAPMHHFLL